MSTKNKILALLESKRGHTISGEDIAKQLNVSRNTVWKAVKELKKNGYEINSSTNKGYCLCESNDILSVEGIRPYLSQESAAENIKVYDSLESTNKTAKEMAVASAEHGTTVIADCQTAGKGRYGRSFYSPPGQGIYISLILHPSKLLFNTPTLVTSFAAVSVCEAIEALTEKTALIKWVNDIFINGKKICGILTEAVTDFESGSIQWIVVGIGINFIAHENDFPPELRQTAGAVFSGEKPNITRNHLAAEIINRIMSYSYTEKEMLEKYKKRLFMLGKNISVIGSDEPYEATAVDIDDIGRLIVKKNNGELMSLSAGEISIRTNLQ